MEKPNDANNGGDSSVESTDLLAVLAPVLDWYQSDEHPERAPLDILRDIVADLQSDRADNLQLRRTMARVRDTAIAMKDSRPGSVILAEGPERLRAMACESLSANAEVRHGGPDDTE